MTLRLARLLLTVFAAAMPFHVSAANLPMDVVHFESAVLPPTPYKVKQAETQGKEPTPESGFPLWGHLKKPRGDGPFPAVILMHGCAGLHPTYARWARLLVEQGYVTLLLDSFRPRSVFNICTSGFSLTAPIQRALDAYGALAHLQELPFVDPDRIGVMGWSHGGISALEAVHDTAITMRLPQRFKAAIAFYPYCIDDRRFALPVLVLIGEADDWTPAGACRSLEARNRRDGGTLELVVYPGAYHSFDAVEVRKGWAVPGGDGKQHWLKYDEMAHKDSIARVNGFLAEHLSRK